MGTLLAAAELAARRGRMSAHELVKLTERAAALELSGAAWKDLREECAQAILADGLARTAGTLPNHEDAQHSLTAYCGRARNWRRSRTRERERDTLAAELAADAHAASLDALDPAGQLAARESAELNRPTAASARARTSKSMRRIGSADENVRALLYRAARESDGLEGPAIARELAITPGALRKRCERGAAALAQLTSAAQLLARLTDSAPACDAHGLLYGHVDASCEARGHGETATGRLIYRETSDWRVRPDRPVPFLPRAAAELAPAAQGIAPIKVRTDRRYKPTNVALTPELRTAARAALRAAEESSRRPTPHGNKGRRK